MGEVMGAAMGVPFDLVLGRKTYDIFAAHWPHASDDDGAKPLNDATKHVASRSRLDLTWRNSVQIEGDAAAGIAALKQEDGPELQVHGSGNLIQTLLRHEPDRRVPPLGLPARDRVGQAPVRGWRRSRPA